MLFLSPMIILTSPKSVSVALSSYIFVKYIFFFCLVFGISVLTKEDFSKASTILNAASVDSYRCAARQCILQKNKKTLTRLMEIENVILFLRRVNAFYGMSH